jgi:glycosyltransferase involved in cell wall biosynthesis
VTRPLNVLHVVSSLAGGGVERLLVKSLAVLDRESLVHQVCCVSTGGIYEEELRSLGIPCWVMKRRARFDPTVTFQMIRLMRYQRIDVVHTLGFTANAWGRTAAKLAGVPRIIAHERGTAWTESAVMRLVDRLLYHWTDLLLANSEAARIMLTQRIWLPAGRIRVVFNGLPAPRGGRGDGPSLRERLCIGPKVPLVGIVGRLDTPKGHVFLLRAMPLVWQSVPGTHLVIIGDGPLRGYLESESHRLGLLDEGRVHFLGFLPDAIDLMPEMDLLAHPAIREALGNVLIEAGLARIPVVASNVDGCAEVVVDGETGLLVDCTLPVQHVRALGASPLPTVVVDGRTHALRPPLGPSPEVLAQAIVMLLREPLLRHNMGQWAHERAQHVFSLDRYVRSLERAYRGDL